MKDARKTLAELDLHGRPTLQTPTLRAGLVPWRAVAPLATLAALMALLTLTPSEATAQTAPASGAPGTQEMIQVLRPQGANRNLVVRPRQPEGAGSAATGSTGTAATASPPTALAAGAAPTAPTPVTAPPAVAPAPAQAAAPAPAPTPAPTPAPVATAVAAAPAVPAPGPGLTLAIEFDNNSARVRPESGPLLGNLVAALQSPELKGTRFLIEGHTDARGNAATNQRLSLERAEEVRLYLVALGVHPARLRAVGKGSSEPALPQDPAAAANRRVRVVTQP